MQFHRLRRRAFITLLGGVAAWPVTASGQQMAKVARIGFLALGNASAWTERVEALRSGLRDLGYVEGNNILIEFRWAKSVDELPELAADLARTNVDVIFADSSIFVEPARQATKTIPIVFAAHADPVGLGHVASLARPGGNITGLSMVLTELAAKELEMLNEALPQAKRIGVLWNPATPSHRLAVQAVAAAGEKLAVQLLMLPLVKAEDFDVAFATMSRERADGFLEVPSVFTLPYRNLLAELALRHRFPSMFGRKDNVEAGGLMSYSADTIDLHRRAAVYIDKILRGAKPADLPVEQASKYALVINLKTAKALSLEIPPMVLARADEVIE